MTTALTKGLGHEAELQWMKTDHVLGKPVDVGRLPELAAEIRAEADEELSSLAGDLDRLIDVAEDVLERLEASALPKAERTKLARRLAAVLDEVSPGLFD